jgi:hypothetical protein
LSVAFDSIPLLSQILGRNPTSNFVFSAQIKTDQHIGPAVRLEGQTASGKRSDNWCYRKQYVTPFRSQAHL